MIAESLVDRHRWLRIAEAAWEDPLDPTYAATHGGRWNPPDSWPTLYLNEDRTTARINTEVFIGRWPYEPEDLQPGAGPVLLEAVLPDGLRTGDVHTPAGVAAAGLPAGFPIDEDDAPIGHDRCQPIGEAARAAGLDGVRARSARAPRGAGRELAWFPTEGATATAVRRVPFVVWYFG